jgi:SAM-dependent methyltransferase
MGDIFKLLKNKVYTGAYFDGSQPCRHEGKNRAGGLSPDHWDLHMERWKQTAENVAKMVSGCVLEVGCGRGPVVHHLIESHGIDAYGIDISRHIISRPISPLVERRIMTQSIHATSFPDFIFDGILLLDVLEHIPYDFLHSTMQEIVRICKDDAVFMCTIPDNDDYIYSSDAGLREHYIVKSPSWWEAELKDYITDFEVIKNDEYPFNMAPNNTFFRGKLIRCRD